MYKLSRWGRTEETKEGDKENKSFLVDRESIGVCVWEVGGGSQICTYFSQPNKADS